ncbi:MAG: hypothetical protein ABIP97_02260, partial [Chthoniobacterales bacterium]
MTDKRSEKKRTSHAIQRVAIVGLCAILVAIFASYFTASTIKSMKQAAHYTTLDLRRLQFALYAFELKSRLTGGPHYPATLQDL